MIKYYLCIICLICINNKITLAFDKPDIVWEKQIPFTEKSVNPWTFMNYSDSGILLWLEGIDTVVNPKNMFSVLLLDKNGNEKIRKDYVRLEQLSAGFTNVKIFNNNNHFKIIGTLGIQIGGYVYLPIKKLNIDNECNVIGNINDTINPQNFITTAMPNFLYDSVYVGAFDFDSTIYNFVQSLWIYNSEGEFVRKLTLDTSGINIPIEMKNPQTEIFPCDDGNIITKMLGPIKYKNSSAITEYVLLCKYNLNGILIWRCKIPINESGFDQVKISKVYQLSDGSFNFIGNLRNYGGLNPSAYKAIIGNISDIGVLNWMQEVDYISEKCVTTKEPVVIRNGDYFVIYGLIPLKETVSRYNFWFMIIDKYGKKIEEYVWNTMYTGDKVQHNNILDIAITNENNLIILGQDGFHSVYLAEVKPKFSTNVIDNASQGRLFDLQLYPNPARTKINIDFGVEPINLSNTKIEIYDYLGRYATELKPEVTYDSGTGRGTMTCDISNLRSGYYIAVLTNGKNTRSMPLFIE